MTKYHLGSDRSGGGDEECLKEIKSALESAGHEVNYLRIDPNLESDLASNVKEGEIGLYGVNGFCIGTMVSVSSMAKKKGIDVIFFAMKTHTSYCEEPDFSSKKVDFAHDDNFSSAESRRKYGGNKYTPKQVVDKLDNISFVTWQGSCKKQAEGILNGVTGGDDTDSTTGEESVMSGWDSLCDLLKPLDGLAMMVQRGDTVIVKRISVPEENMGDASKVTRSIYYDSTEEDKNKNQNQPLYESYQTTTQNTGINNPTVNDNVKLYAYEGVNIVADSVTVTEYTPEIYNTLKVSWGENYENDFTLCFEKHKELYGERLKEVQACKKENIATEEETEEDSE